MNTTNGKALFVDVPPPPPNTQIVTESDGGKVGGSDVDDVDIIEILKAMVY